ncbi:MAG: InlB B-repeat-containing protein [Clostridia bacterium]|nr:InlB B-repeat-containing protein [Clostridia bacterium]
MKKSTFTKLLCIVLMSLMVLSLVACGGNRDTDTEDAPTTAVVAYDTVGGQLPEGTEEVKEYDIGKKLMILPTPTKTGYEFLGWEINGEAVTLPYTVNEDVTFTAKWQSTLLEGDGSDTATDSNNGGSTANTDTETEDTRPRVMIYLDANGGTLPANQLEEWEAVVGDAIGKLPTPTRAGYNFLGWFEDGNAKWEVDRKTEVEDYDMTIVALWEALGDIVTVEFNVAVDETLSIDTPYFEMVSGQKINGFMKALPTATKSGYKFAGWQDANGNTVTVTSTITKDTVLSPVWTRVVVCLDGTENHQWNAWQEDSEATCTEPAKETRTCSICGATDVNITQEALGHKFGAWATTITENGIVRSRVCVECDEKEADPLTNISFDAFNTPVIDGDCWGGDKGANLINGNYTDKDMCGKGTGALVVTMDAKEAVYVDIFAVTGFGSASYYVTVYYNDGTFKDIGVGSFGSGDTATKAFNIGATVTKIVVTMESPSNGTDYWSELSVLVVPTNE